MKLLEALEIVRKPVAEDAPAFNIFLGCRFTPVYLKTYLHAHLKQRLPERSLRVETGVFGDLAGELERLGSSDKIGNLHGCIVVVEWPDLDERLGYRTAGGWRIEKLGEVSETIARSLERLKSAVERIADRIPLVVSTPGLAPAPISFARPDHGDSMFWEMESVLTSWALRLAAHERVGVLNPRWLDAVSPLSARADYKSNLANGYPYQLEHTDVLAGAMASFVAPPPPTKGLITDLDDTLWLGILGEAGVDGVQWTLEYKAQVHGLYQQLLQSLIDSGILVGVASKNDPHLADQLWHRRTDLLVEADALFPKEVNWGPKSQSVSKILKAWNIGAEAVLFIDDSPMEVAEVMAAHPRIQGIVFPKEDPAGVVNLLTGLRHSFGKSTVTAEDKLRARSLRATTNVPPRDPGEGGATPEEFLRSANAILRIDCANPPRDGRALELVNKTNQFNLNGFRYTEAEWHAELWKQGALLCVVSYEDRFGPLGRISVLAGWVEEGVLKVSAWVMSCRAFSRHIEYGCLRYMFDGLG
ncbi:MAG: HAD-IIIC family phosphatase, partial [Bryobacteraceae bacterium]